MIVLNRENEMQTNSLAAASISNRMSERHGESHMTSYTHEYLGMTFMGRYCTVAGVRSGGYVLMAGLDESYGHTSKRFIKTTIRLKPGWTSRTKQRAIQRLILKLSEDRTLKRHRELVYQIAESHAVDLDRIDKMSEAENHTTVYDDMTLADCLFWEVELAKYPALVPESA